MLYNNFFPKHRDRLDKKLSELMQTVAKLVLHQPEPLISDGDMRMFVAQPSGCLIGS